jgi:2-polyprenyl-3-methyl-5-hydroxy-6-metoxy-1,4-benzoquinol methylase
MQLKDIQHKHNDTVTDTIPAFAAPQIHETVFDSFLKCHMKKDVKILILGAGAGSFDQKLFRHGYTNITSTDLIEENYMMKGVTFVPFDLNTDFSTLGVFDVVIALEIIEHIENQFHFIREIKKILALHGVLYLSTPNVESTFSRAKFYFFGRLHFFSKEELYGTGHINPVFWHIFKFNLDQSNLEVKERLTNGNVWMNALPGASFFTKIAYIVFFLLSFLTLKRDNKDIAIYKIVHKGN